MSRILLFWMVATLTITTALGEPPDKQRPIVSKPVKPTTSPSLRELAQRKQAAGERKEANPERSTLDEKLAEYKGVRFATVGSVESTELTSLFPKTVFFSLRLRQYPVAIAPSEPLKTNNVFAVTGKKVLHLRSAAELGDYFQRHLKAVKDQKTAKTATTATLRLYQEFKQDGFFRFQQPEIAVTFGKGGPIAQGTVRVIEDRGDKGTLTVFLSFLDGKLETVKFGGKLSPGIRPRCQAKRLLDPDPAIRQIMRRDLVVMGSSAMWYLVEQWQNADPRLREVLEGVWRQIIDEGR